MRAVALIIPLLGVACASRLTVFAPLTAPVSSYDCAIAVDAASCSPATVLNPAADTAESDATINLPAECQGNFGDILLRKRRSAKRHAVVACGAAGSVPLVCEALPDDFQPSLTTAPSCVALSGPSKTNGLVLALPPQCDGLANQLIIDRLGARKPRSSVTCAAPDNQPGSTP